MFRGHHHTLDCPKRKIGVDASFPIGDLKKATGAPACAPGVFTDPALFGFGVPDHLDTMQSGYLSSYMMVYTATIGVKIIEHLKHSAAWSDLTQIALALFR